MNSEPTRCPCGRPCIEPRMIAHYGPGYPAGGAREWDGWACEKCGRTICEDCAPVCRECRCQAEAHAVPHPHEAFHCPTCDHDICEAHAVFADPNSDQVIGCASCEARKERAA